MGTVAVIPAHNEATTIAAAVGSVLPQVDEVVVVADNCTDDTAELARSAGAEVFRTVDNYHRKAGALNQALPGVLDRIDPYGLVLVQDADSTLAPDFMEAALGWIADQNVGAVSGMFYGRPGGGLLGLFQRMEYVRYARDLRRSGRVWVLTGTATVFRADVLREIQGTKGRVYDPAALTEDMEITLAVKDLGYECRSPSRCAVVTEVMPTVRDLWHQRLRWQRGALENLAAYGMHRLTLPYFGQQALLLTSILALWLFAAMTGLSIAEGTFGLSLLWSGVMVVFATERVVTVWPCGWRARLLAVGLLPEIAYAMFLQVVFLAAARKALQRKPAEWRHLEREGV